MNQCLEAKSPKKDVYEELILHNALLMTEVGMDLKDRYISGDKYICQLKTILSGADKALSALHFIAKSSLDHSHKMILSITENNSSSQLKKECEKLLAIIENQLNDLEFRNLDTNCPNLDLPQISEKIRSLEIRQKLAETNSPTPTMSSNKTVKAEVNERYPENVSRESLIDLNAVNLPPVPEDIFTSFSSKPTRSSSLSSLKSMRKIKMYLQKAESSDDDDSSEAEDQECSSKLIYVRSSFYRFGNKFLVHRIHNGLERDGE